MDCPEGGLALTELCHFRGLNTLGMPRLFSKLALNWVCYPWYYITQIFPQHAYFLVSRSVHLLVLVEPITLEWGSTRVSWKWEEIPCLWSFDRKAWCPWLGPMWALPLFLGFTPPYLSSQLLLMAWSPQVSHIWAFFPGLPVPCLTPLGCQIHDIFITELVYPWPSTILG
jgi:hypothetical protein